MTYEIKIKQDYNVKVRRSNPFDIIRFLKYTTVISFTVSVYYYLGINFFLPTNFNSEIPKAGYDIKFEYPYINQDLHLTIETNDNDKPETINVVHTNKQPGQSQGKESNQKIQVLEKIPALEIEKNTAVFENNIENHRVTIKRGESLALIFKRLGISATTLHTIIHSHDSAKVLKHIKPGEELTFTFKKNKLDSLIYQPSLTQSLNIHRTDDKFVYEIQKREVETKECFAEGTINHSLYMAGKNANITDNIIMQLVNIYGWDIDFSQEIHQGDTFKIVFEEHYLDDKKIGEGKILAAEFINQGKSLKTVYFQDLHGEYSGYYSDNGHSMKKAFLRMPVDFARISSRFNLKRRHPLLNTIRAHKGVDYAAATGTPIKASGDGVVQFRGNKGGYGRTIILKHGGHYTTLYAHMSGYHKNIHIGKRVKQGEIIGYIGQSGLATGPHLHYEFRVNGIHRNPLTVTLPKARTIPTKRMAEFKQYTTEWLAKFSSEKPIKLAHTNTGDGILSVATPFQSEPKTN